MADNAAFHDLPGMVSTAVRCRATIVEQVRMARETWRLRLRCPEIARQILPGQFFMVRLPDETDPLLGRPFALYDIYEEQGQPAGIDFGYLVVGKLTSLLQRCAAGDELEVWGPLGNGFPIPPAGHLMLVAGGIGQTPFLAVAQEALGLQTYGDPPRAAETRAERVSICYGVRSADYLAGLDDFEIPGLALHLATDDGSRGHYGFVTDLLTESFDSDSPPDAVYTCGPEPMMQAVGRMCLARDVPCLLSLETPMACGFGACFSCVTRVKQADGSWDYRRTCVEGPVFAAELLLL